MGLSFLDTEIFFCILLWFCECHPSEDFAVNNMRFLDLSSLSASYFNVIYNIYISSLFYIACCCSIMYVNVYQFCILRLHFVFVPTDWLYIYKRQKAATPRATTKSYRRGPSWLVSIHAWNGPIQSLTITLSYMDRETSIS